LPNGSKAKLRCVFIGSATSSSVAFRRAQSHIVGLAGAGSTALRCQRHATDDRQHFERNRDFAMNARVGSSICLPRASAHSARRVWTLAGGNNDSKIGQAISRRDKIGQAISRREEHSSSTYTTLGRSWTRSKRAALERALLVRKHTEVDAGLPGNTGNQGRVGRDHFEYRCRRWADELPQPGYGSLQLHCRNCPGPAICDRICKISAIQRKRSSAKRVNNENAIFSVRPRFMIAFTAETAAQKARA
jgi:hypothetical protein